MGLVLAGGMAPFLVTKSDTANQPFNALYVGGTGNIVVVNPDGSTVLFSAIPVGALLPVAGIRVNSTNTTATLIVGLQ